MPRITPTCVPQSFDDIERALDIVSGFARSLHLDINDGVFASPRTWPYEATGMGTCALPATDLSITAHLMVQEPREVGEALVRAGAYGIIAHREVFESLAEYRGVIESWRMLGAQSIGLAIMLESPLSLLDTFVEEVDFIHVMTVREIGAQGASFEVSALERIAEVHRKYPQMPIEVDGGIQSATIAHAMHAGASRFAVGSAIMHAMNSMHAYNELEELITEK